MIGATIRLSVLFSGGRAAAAMVALAGLLFVSNPFVLDQPAEAADPQNRVQLQVFQVKVVDPKGTLGQLPVTVYIDVPNRKSSTDVCAMAPRLRDALNTHLRKETYKLDERGNIIDVARMSQAARPIVEGAAKAENVAGVEIKQGAPQVKASAASMLQRSGCIGVADANEEPKGGAKKGEAKSGGK
jgi:hypothetical protein